jgi:alcohol dehydrogenase, propanol-preferring
MKSAKIMELINLLQIQESKTPKPKGSQVLVKVQSYGLYHKDIYLLEGAYER